VSGWKAPFSDLADRAPYIFKHTIGDVEARCPPVAGIFVALVGGTLYSGDQTGAVKRVAEPGLRINASMQSG
jgi:hypothetical protein